MIVHESDHLKIPPEKGRSRRGKMIKNKHQKITIIMNRTTSTTDE
jgi:hypothetical protein